MTMETPTEATNRLETVGYRGAFAATPARLACPICEDVHDPNEVQIHELVRVQEKASRRRGGACPTPRQGRDLGLYRFRGISRHS